MTVEMMAVWLWVQEGVVEVRMWGRIVELCMKETVEVMVVILEVGRIVEVVLV